MFLFPQNNDSTQTASHFGGAVTVVKNGISFIPILALGKPAAIFDLSLGREKLSFEPQFRFALEGKPWSFLFTWRYKLLRNDKVQITLSARPGISFRTITSTIDGVSKENIVARRLLGVDLAPNFFLAESISLGFNYFYAYGVEKEITRNSQMLSLRSNFSNIRLSNQLYMRLAPQIYYLKLDKKDGVYFSSSLTLAKINFPISVSASINKTIQTEITAPKNFLWDVSLIYTFNKEYVNK